MRYFLFFLLPVFAFATTRKNIDDAEIEQIAIAAESFLIANPDALSSSSSSIAERLVSDTKSGVYLRFDNKRISSEGLHDKSGNLYLILASKDGICVVAPDKDGDYNGRAAKHWFRPAKHGERGR
jgi:hypothetical protein